MMYRCFCLLLVMAWQASLSAETHWEVKGAPGFSVKADLTPNKGIIPEPFQLKVELDYPADYQPDIGEMRANILRFDGIYPPFHLVKEDVRDAHHIEYTLEPLLEGNHPLTFFAIPFHSKEGKPTVKLISGIFTYSASMPTVKADVMDYTAPLLPLDNPLPIRVNGDLRRQLMQADEKQMAQTNAIIESRAFPWQGVLGILLVGAIFLAIKLSPKNKKPTPRHLRKSTLAYEKSKELYARIQADSSQELSQSYFTALTDAVRYSVEEKYGLAATTQTSEEFLQHINEERLLDAEQAKRLNAFLQICDGVKFGKVHATPEEAKQALEVALQLQ